MNPIEEALKNLSTTNNPPCRDIHISNYSKNTYDKNDKSPFSWSVTLDDKNNVIGVQAHW